MHCHPVGVRAIVKVHVQAIAKVIVPKMVAKGIVVVLALVHAVVRTNDNQTSEIMDKKTTSEALQTRRKFFKSASKRALPIMGLLLASRIPAIGHVTEPTNEMGCKTGCSGGCRTLCEEGCSHSCNGNCKDTCSGHCNTTCKGTATNYSK